MADERGRNKRKREQKRNERLKKLLGIDLCACGCSHTLTCAGSCRNSHINSNTGIVECGALYQIDHSLVKQGGPRKPKRTWKYGRQKEGNENIRDKQRRREKWERDKA